MRFKIVIAALVAVAVVTDVGVTLSTRRAEAVEGKVPAADPGAAIAQLQARVNELEGRVPDQAIVMTHVAYHFTNLWFAARQQNWPLADFYLGEVRKDLKWAVRVRPVREGPAGEGNGKRNAGAGDNKGFSKVAAGVQKERRER